MTQPNPLTIPLINPNEREAVLTGLFLREGQLVKAGELAATIESTKSTLEIFTPESGYVIGLCKQLGDSVTTGEVLCYLAESPSDAPPVKAETTSQIQPSISGNLRITQPALKLAKEANLNLDQFQPGLLITEAMVKRAIQSRAPDIALTATENSLVIFGGGGHGKSLLELIRASGKHNVIGIVDDGIPVGQTVLDVPVLGGADSLSAIVQQGVGLAVNGVGGIGNLKSRLRVFELLQEAGFALPVVIHPRALCEPSSSIEVGTQVFALAYIGSSSRVGVGCIINTGAIVSHDCVIGDYSNLSPGAILAGSVVIEEQVLVGMGVTINLNVRVGAGARIGNGATIKADVPAGSVVRAGTIWPNQV